MDEKTYVDDIDRSVYDIKDDEKDAYRLEAGLTPKIVEQAAVQGEARSRLDGAVPAGGAANL